MKRNSQENLLHLRTDYKSKRIEHISRNVIYDNYAHVQEKVPKKFFTKNRF